MPKTSADLRMQSYTFIPQIKSAVFECISVEADSPSFLNYKNNMDSVTQSIIPPFIQSVIQSTIQSISHSTIHSIIYAFIYLFSQSVSHLVSHSVSLFKFEQHPNAFH